ncbi:MAG: methyltransferase, partial [Oscillospiraceae bacterium]|nr:methyltransferase [Oscillospiraceae bacterium]
MAVPAYDPKELTVVGEIPPRFGIGLPIPIYSYPVTPKEAFKAMVQRQPVWQISGIESKIFAPKLLPDNVARAMVIQEEPFDNLNDGGGKDMFGLEWEYIAQVGGSMIRPGKPFLEDANEWYDK